MLCFGDRCFYVCLNFFTCKMRNATPEEQQEWFEEDFFMKGDFDVTKLFVVVPAVIQVMCLGMMGLVMLFNSYLF